MFALLGENLRRLRKEKNLTLDRLGDAAELGRGQLSRIENSHQEATLTTLAKVLTAQGVSRREFFRRYDLVEAEALGVERQQAGGAASGEGPWPQKILDAMSQVEAFAHGLLQRSLPVAQGAIEVGDLVILFRVVPKGAGTPPPASGAGGIPDEPPLAPTEPPRRRSGAPARPVKRRRPRSSEDAV
jgi:transcriptional regulator with XRE-family HTH domain